MRLTLSFVHFKNANKISFHTKVREKINIDEQDYLLELSKKLNIKTMEDWYDATYDRNEFFLGFCKSLFGGSQSKAIMSLYPEYKWLPWKFKIVPKGFWEERNNIKQYLDWLSQKLDIKTMEDWYKVTHKDFTNNYGRGLINNRVYKGSQSKIIMANYPNYEWLPWKFSVTTHGYWDEQYNIKKYLDWLSVKLNINTMEDWYNVTYKDFTNNHGRGLVEKYKGSFIKLLMTNYPDYEWLPWRFTVAPHGFWKDLENQTLFINYLKLKLDIKEKSDWYQVRYEDIIRHGGGGIMKEYNTIFELLNTLYPNEEWDIYQFSKLPYGFKKTIKNDSKVQKEFVQYMEKKFNITKTSDWYLITTKQLHEIITMNITDAMSIVKQYHRDLDMKYFKYGNANTLRTKKSQYTLKNMLKILFPEQEIIEEYRCTELNNLELDYYLPNLSIAFEYQGELHYNGKPYFRNLYYTNKLDEMKIMKTRGMGITLFQIPYWWDKKLTSLRGTITASLPNILSKEISDQPIPIEPPVKKTTKESN